MATPTAELARAAFDALADGGVEALLAYVDPDFEMETLPGIAAEPQVYRGHDGVRRWFETFYEVMDEIAIELRDVTDLGGDRALVELTTRARGHASGLEVEQDATAIAVLRDDLIVRLEFLLPGDEPPAAH